MLVLFSALLQYNMKLCHMRSIYDFIIFLYQDIVHQKENTAALIEFVYQFEYNRSVCLTELFNY